MAHAKNRKSTTTAKMNVLRSATLVAFVAVKVWALTKANALPQGSWETATVMMGTTTVNVVGIKVIVVGKRIICSTITVKSVSARIPLLRLPHLQPARNRAAKRLGKETTIAMMATTCVDVIGMAATVVAPKKITSTAKSVNV